jgi:dipeptidyl aminopeptidase/acylaminoacyl peptidase
MKLIHPCRTNTIVVLTLLCVFASSYAQNLTVREIMAEPSIAGMRAEGEKLSPDGTKVVYLWNAEGKLPRDLYLVPTSGGDPVKILSPADLPPPSRPPRPESKLDYGLVLRDDFVKARENQLGNFEWSPDSKRLVFSHGGDLYVLTLGEAKPRRFTKTQTPETGARFLDNDRILFSQSGHLMVWDLKNSMLTQISREANPQNFVGVFGGVPNKPGTLIAYVVSDSSKSKALVVPNYLDELVTANPTRRGWTEQKVMVMPADASRDTPFEIKLPKPEGVSSIRRMVWVSDNSSLLVDRIDKDTKRRTLYYVHNVGSKGEEIIPIIEETDDKWQASLSNIFEPNPKDPSELFFASEKDGYNHLYLAKLEALGVDSTAETQRRGGTQAETRTVASVTSDNERVAEGPPGFSGKVTITQVTKGNWQVEWAKWGYDGGEIVYSSTQTGTGVREFHITDSNPSGLKFQIKAEGLAEGMKTSPQYEQLELGKGVLLYTFSRWNQPEELIVQGLCDVGCNRTPLRLTNTVPARFTTTKWTEPKFLEIPSRDGKKIPAKIYLPPGFKAKGKQKFPMAIFVHGAGYLQNVINGWNNYYREFMFNDMLAKKGYVVLDIDYRGSAGYGRDWRTDVYDFLGGKDYDDHIDSIDYMVANYNVNPAKVGAYGGSYGGFMAGMLVMRAPDKIAAAAALRPVFDWKNYYAANPGYTAQRLGFPDKNPEAYRRSSPITYADKLERPLLILHGMSDDNVHVQDSIQLMEKLIRLGKTKYFEAMLYPSENHAFVRPESWADEYERILAFFEKHLK